ncbi:MAG: TonB-dependent receptor [Bacteroidetes bacterium]|nr:TonB-dependent receptor [Bacteroidota bacterium]
MRISTRTPVRLSLTILFCLLASLSFAQTATLVGKVVSSSNDLPIESATISIKGKNTVTSTDQEGRFLISTQAGSTTLVFTFLNAQPIEKKVNPEAGKKTDMGTIKLDVKENELKEVVVDGMIRKFAEKKSDYVARMPLKNIENSQVYTVVPKELLQEQVAVDFRNVLTSAPGVSAASLGVGSGGTGYSMRLRGFAGADGAGSIRNGMATNFVSLSDPANLESVEVIKGPSATLFGTTLISYGGLINRVTKKAYNGKGGEIGLSTGAWGLGRFTFDYNTPLDNTGKALFRINTALHKENTWQDYGINKTFMVAPTFTYQASDRLKLTVDAEYFNSNRNTTYVNLTASGLTNINQLAWNWDKSFASNDVTSKAEVLNIFGEAKYTLSDKWISQTLVSYARTDNNANYLFLDVSSADSLTRRYMHIPSIFTTQQLQQNFNGDLKIGSIRNRMLVGFDYTKLTTVDTRITLSSYDGKKLAIQGTAVPVYEDVYNTKLASASTRASRRFTRTYSAYISDVVDITDRLNVMASVRFDRFDDVQNSYIQSSWSPKFGAVYQVLKDRASVFANYMDGFQNKGPAAADTAGTIKAFKPEHAKQLEAGIKLEFFGRKLSSTISYYHIKVNDRIRSVTAPTGSAVSTYSVQDATQKSEGFEIDLIANPIDGLHIILGYGYNDNKFIKGAYDGKRDLGTPRQIANFWISHRLASGPLSGFGVGFGGNFASSSYLNSTYYYTMPGYGKLDATVFYEKSNVRFAAKINNLTDKRYWLGDYYGEVQAPRQFLANVTFKF